MSASAPWVRHLNRKRATFSLGSPALEILLGITVLGALHAGPTPQLTLWFTQKGAGYFQGDGGTVKRVQGIEVWLSGRPDKSNLTVGYVQTVRSNADVSNGRIRDFIELNVARMARSKGADAIVPLGQTFQANHPDQRGEQYRALKYAQPLAGESLVHDDSVEEADGSLLPNYNFDPISYLHIPQTGDFYRGNGRPVLRICVPADGKPKPATEHRALFGHLAGRPCQAGFGG